MKEYVIDASVAAKWFFDEPQSDLALRILAGSVPLVAPDLLRIEFANVLWTHLRRKQISSEQAHTALGDFLGLPIQFEASGNLVAPAMALAVELRQTVYDCLYLATAIERNCKLITADERFLRALPETLKNHAEWVGRVD